ncbi:hypothetical protein F5Y14DRAFT_205427 [Nemania sp. NC0429]|nr:hypothetical protein F5Y14DRAFT_205427 [Nemania sp. NC0429]
MCDTMCGKHRYGANEGDVLHQPPERNSLVCLLLDTYLKSLETPIKVLYLFVRYSGGTLEGSGGERPAPTPRRQTKAKANPIAPIPVSHLLLLDSLPAHWLPIPNARLSSSLPGRLLRPSLSGLEPFRLSARVGQGRTRMLLSCSSRLLSSPPVSSRLLLPSSSSSPLRSTALSILARRALPTVLATIPAGLELDSGLTRLGTAHNDAVVPCLSCSVCLMLPLSCPGCIAAARGKGKDCRYTMCFPS